MTAQMEPPEFYNGVYSTHTHYWEAPKESPFYEVWQRVLNRHLTLGWRILDVGCGPGQFAQLCLARGYEYVGVDFSPKALALAEKRVPRALLHLVNVNKNLDLISRGDYDVVTFIEFLEHIEGDLRVLKAVPSGKRVILSVPNYITRGHVREFKDMSEVKTRYGDLIKIIATDTVIFEGGNKIFIVSGLKKIVVCQEE